MSNDGITEIEWISTRDRKPEDGQTVEIMSSIVCKARYEPHCKFAQWIADEESEEKGLVTHWRLIN